MISVFGEYWFLFNIFFLFIYDITTKIVFLKPQKRLVWFGSDFSIHTYVWLVVFYSTIMCAKTTPQSNSSRVEWKWSEEWSLIMLLLTTASWRIPSNLPLFFIIVYLWQWANSSKKLQFCRTRVYSFLGYFIEKKIIGQPICSISNFFQHSFAKTLIGLP